MTALFWTHDRLDDAWLMLAEGQKAEDVCDHFGVTLTALTNALHRRDCSISTARAQYRAVRLERVLEMRKAGWTYQRIGDELGCGIAQAWRIVNKGPR